MALVWLIFKLWKLNNDYQSPNGWRCLFQKQDQTRKHKQTGKWWNKHALGIRMQNRTYNSGAMAHNTTSHSLLCYVHTEHQMTIELMFDGRHRAPRLRFIIQCSKWSNLISIKVLPSVQTRSSVQDKRI